MLFDRLADPYGARKPLAPFPRSVYGMGQRKTLGAYLWCNMAKKRLTVADLFRDECTNHVTTLGLQGHKVKLDGQPDTLEPQGLAQWAMDVTPEDGVKVSAPKLGEKDDPLTIQRNAVAKPETVARMVLATAGLLMREDRPKSKSEERGAETAVNGNNGQK